MIPVRSLAAVLAAGGLAVFNGTALMPGADAQAPAKAPAAPTKADPAVEVEVEIAAPPAAPKPPTLPAPPATALPATALKGFNYSFSTAGRPAWEYEYADVPAEMAAFKKLLTTKGKDGWEYAGNVKGETEKGAKPAEVAVFKRPAKGSGMMTFTAPAPAAANSVKPVQPLGGLKFVPPSLPKAGQSADADVEQAKAAFAAAKAALDKAEARAKAAGQARTTKVVLLKKASAEDVVNMLVEFFGKRGYLAKDLRLTARPADNAIFIQGAPADAVEVEALIKLFDRAGDAESKKP